VGFFRLRGQQQVVAGPPPAGGKLFFGRWPRFAVGGELGLWVPRAIFQDGGSSFKGFKGVPAVYIN